VNHFPIRFDPWYRVLSIAVLISPSDSFVEIDDQDVVVRMAWAFRARFPRSAIASTNVVSGKVVSRGVHGFSGRWLVNGSGSGILSIVLNPIQTAHVIGLPVQLRELVVSVDDPRALAEAVR
jgi:hypothetical protein